MNTAKYKISFRQAVNVDLAFLISLRKQSMTEHLAKAGICMDDEQHKGRVLEFFSDSTIILLNEKPIGLIKIGHLEASLHIRQFQLLPSYQKRGIGSKVLNAIKQKANRENKPITLFVLLANPAKNLYLKEGFVIEQTDRFQHSMRYSTSSLN